MGKWMCQSCEDIGGLGLKCIECRRVFCPGCVLVHQARTGTHTMLDVAEWGRVSQGGLAPAGVLGYCGTPVFGR